MQKVKWTAMTPNNKTKPLKPIGYEAIDAERKAKTNKEEDKDSK